MPKYKADQADADLVLEDLSSRGYTLASTRVRSDLLVIETADADPSPLARFRRVGADLWALEMPTHRGAWEPAHVRDHLPRLIETLVRDFAWTLAEARVWPERR